MSVTLNAGALIVKSNVPVMPAATGETSTGVTRFKRFVTLEPFEK